LRSVARLVEIRSGTVFGRSGSVHLDLPSVVE
jgi:hypothetical protein